MVVENLVDLAFMTNLHQNCICHPSYTKDQPAILDYNWSFWLVKLLQ